MRSARTWVSRVRSALVGSFTQSSPSLPDNFTTSSCGDLRCRLRSEASPVERSEAFGGTSGFVTASAPGPEVEQRTPGGHSGHTPGRGGRRAELRRLGPEHPGARYEQQRPWRVSDRIEGWSDDLYRFRARSRVGRSRYLGQWSTRSRRAFRCSNHSPRPRQRHC